MDKQILVFLKDYTTVLRYNLGDDKIEIDDVNDILLSDKYYKQYRTEMVNTPDYKEAFLKHFENEFDEKLQIAKNYINDKNKVKNKLKM